MLRQITLSNLHRDLDLLANELKQYPAEDLLWKANAGISNSPGNLALHIVGNLNHFFGATLGNTGYIRQRDLEFSKKDVPLSEIVASIEATKLMLETVIGSMNPEDETKDFPLPFLGKTQSTAFIMVQLGNHLNYHLGQINYHRRLTLAHS